MKCTENIAILNAFHYSSFFIAAAGVTQAVRIGIPSPLLWVVALAMILCHGGTCPAEGPRGMSRILPASKSASILPDLFAARVDGSPPQSMDTNSFKAVLQLIRENYVHKVDSDTIFKNPAQMLVMTLPLLGMKPSPEIPECYEDPQECLMELIQEIAAQYHLNQNMLFHTALTLILGELDHNSCLLDQDMLKELAISTSGKFGGVGMMVAPRKGDYVVVSSFEGSPAYTAGIRPGDIMLEIDGKPIHDLPLMEVLRQVRGPEGSIMSVTVKTGRSGVVRQLRLRRTTIAIPPVRYGMVSEGIGYVRIVNFQAGTSMEMKKALQRLSARNKQKLKGVILDLRDNPGGLLDQAVHAARLFVSSGPIASLRGRDKKLNREFKAERRALIAGVPVVVLINRGSASASEVLAGALQGRPHVLVLGERSFGKASVQAVYPLNEGRALRLTTAHYYTALGRDIEGKGLEPDVIMDEPNEPPAADEMNRVDPSRLRADPWIQESLARLPADGATPARPFPTLY